MNKINPPEPTDSGSFGTQELGVNQVDAGQTLVVHQGPLIAAVKGLEAQGVRSQAATSLVIGVCMQLKSDLDHSRRVNELQEQKVNALQTQLSVSERTVTKLSEQCATAQSERKISGFLAFMGTALIGLSVNLAQGNLTAYAWVVGILGGVALLGSWFTATKKATS